MSLDELSDGIEDSYASLGEERSVSLDRETRNELAMLTAVLDPDDPDELLRRGIHMLFQTTVETGTMDFHLRSSYDVTYDEYLAGMTFDEMTGQAPQRDETDRRYHY